MKPMGSIALPQFSHSVSEFGLKGAVVDSLPSNEPNFNDTCLAYE